MTSQPPVKRRLVGALALVGLLALAAARDGAGGPLSTIGIEELRPGMTGYGLSVFNPTGSIDTFQVELIDIMHGITPGGDLLLCRVAGQGLEHSGIVAGMSGSPVYFDNRLAGALAYGWSFAKDPITGITPIGEMLEVLELPGPSEPGRRGRAGPGSPLPAPDREPRSGTLPRLPLPFGITGSSPGLFALAGSLLEGSGLVPVAAGSVASTDGQSELLPGGAVAVLLADGDLRYSAIGTITWRDGDRLLAFGHPFFQAGPVNLPMAGGRIHSVMPSLATSFKLFSPGPAVGGFHQDRLPAISGTIGPVPPMLPVRVRLEAPTGRYDYRFTVADFPPLLPALTGIGIAELVYATEGVYEKTTLEARVSINLADRPAVSFRHVHADRASADPLARNLMDRLRLLLDNPFEPVQLESLDLALTITPGRRRLTITAVQPARARVAPGDTLTLWFELRDDTGRVSSISVPVAIPATTPVGRLTLSVSSSDTFLLRESYRAPGTVEPRNLAQLLRLIERTGDEDVLVIAGHAMTPGLTLAGRELPAAPPTLRRVLVAGPRLGRAQPTGESLLFTERIQLDGVIAGSFEIPLEVAK